MTTDPHPGPEYDPQNWPATTPPTCVAVGCSNPAAQRTKQPTIDTGDGWVEVRVKLERYTNYGTLHVGPIQLCAHHLEEALCACIQQP